MRTCTSVRHNLANNAMHSQKRIRTPAHTHTQRHLHCTPQSTAARTFVAQTHRQTPHIHTQNAHPPTHPHTHTPTHKRTTHTQTHKCTHTHTHTYRHTPASYSPKHGSVFPEDMRGTRRPSSSCCPRTQLIWEKLTIEPLAPLTVMRDRQLRGKACVCECVCNACMQNNLCV